LNGHEGEDEEIGVSSLMYGRKEKRREEKGREEEVDK